MSFFGGGIYVDLLNKHYKRKIGGQAEVPLIATNTYQAMLKKNIKNESDQNDFKNKRENSPKKCKFF